MNNGFSLFEQINPTNKDISIVFSPTTPVINYEYYIVKDGVNSDPISVVGNNPASILLTETGNYQIVVKTYNYYNQINTITSGNYVIDKELPVINLKEKNIELELNSDYNFLNNVSATDNQDGDLSQNIIIENNENVLGTSGLKEVTYTVVDKAGNMATEMMNVNVVDNRISSLASVFVGLLLIILVLLISIYYRMTKLVKRIGSYGLEPINDNSPSLIEQLVNNYVDFLDGIGKYLNKSVFITKYANRYNRYIGIANKSYKNNMNYIANKFVVSFLFLLIALISEAITTSTLSFEIIVLPLIVGFFIPDGIYIYKYHKYRGNLENDFLQAIIIMNNSFKSGRSISQAVDIVAKELDGAMSLEFKKMGLELSFGLSVEVVFRRFSERVNLDEAKYLTASISILNKTGGNIIKVFSSIEKTLFNKKKLKLEMMSLTGASRIIVYALIAVPILFVVFISFINPTYFMPLITTELGYIITSIIVIVYIIYIFFVFKIMKVRM